ncbi:MAG: C69 family dipeptidase, partial [Parabacteroides sp.]|nr:C69 family dipeptidase [Parabacteroides sp.]
MKKTGILVTICMLVFTCWEAMACTGLLVGKKASVDGSVMISYAADSHTLYGELYRWPAAKWPKGTMLDIHEWDTNKYLGKIPQAEETYSVIGNMNEYQLAITESTFGGREELIDSTGIMDYGSLIYVTLQRCKTAREAIKMMTDLVKEYGYYSTGESFSIADKNEIWIMEMIGKGVGNKGAVWVAIRIPDDCIAAHANQSRIQQIPFDDKENCIYSPDVVSFAREKG